VKAYANSKGVKLLGDMPIYVGGHSADVWSNRQLWTLDERGLSAAVSGVPPDAFSDDGQLWGSPLYDWAAHEKVRHLRERDRETEREKVGMHAERQREREREIGCMQRGREAGLLGSFLWYRGCAGFGYLA
jgi:hypothetical protein